MDKHVEAIQVIPERFYTFGETAQILGVSKNFITEETKANKFKIVWVFGSRRIPGMSITEYVKDSIQEWQNKLTSFTGEKYGKNTSGS